ncbi:hypothetical protein J437_LFUL003401 [Ladona fulva]|uniref:Uncharacterized protein n=1 Tax=Ladona fulva TaxID=123851 RepID=A0A8K0NWL4_LADFU|nr:hypothetical protein J437_LFUL003401 [Ladona fulva]
MGFLKASKQFNVSQALKDMHPSLSIRTPENTSGARAMGFNKVTVWKFNSLINYVIDKHKLTADKIFNCDETGAERKDEDILSYCEHLDDLHSDFNQQFDDILKMNIPDWILDPFSSANTEESPQLQEELMEVTTNDELKFKFKSGYQQFWLQKEIPTAYPEIWAWNVDSVW